MRFGAFAASANFAVDREVPVPAFGQGLGGCAKSETEKSKLSELRDRGAVADYFLHRHDGQTAASCMKIVDSRMRSLRPWRMLRLIWRFLRLATTGRWHLQPVQLCHGLRWKAHIVSKTLGPISAVLSQRMSRTSDAHGNGSNVPKELTCA